MNVRWYHSLSFKLFILMSLSLLVTVTGISWQHTTVLRDFLYRSLEDGTVLKAREVGGNLNAVLQHWSSLGNVALSRMAGSTPEAYEDFVKSFVQSDPELVAFHVIKADSPGSVVFAMREGSGASAKLQAFNQAWVKKLARKKTPARLEVVDLQGPTGLPLLNVALRFRIAGETADNWAVISARRARVLDTIPKDSTMVGWVLDRRLQPVFHSAKGRASKLDQTLLSHVRTTKGAFGYRAYKAADGTSELGAFSNLPDYGLVVVVTQDADGAELAITRTLMRTLIWAWVFVLFAILMSFLSSTGVTSNLKAVTAATQRIASGDFRGNLPVKSKDEIAAVSGAVNVMAQRIQDLLETQVEAARAEKELETARLVQSTLFPRNGLTTEALSVTAKSFPATECGGDWWGHFKSGDGKHYLLIADATGHGAAAAIVTAVAYAVCKSLELLFREGIITRTSPSDILRLLNAAMYETGSGTTTMTFFAAAFDLEKGIVSFANAGHCMPYIVPVDPEDERLKASANSAARKFRHYKLKTRGAPLGMERAPEYEEGQIAVVPGDKFVFYTDGIYECNNKGGAQWGERSLRKTLDSVATIDGEEFQERILGEAFGFFDGQPLKDDITLVVLHVAKTWRPGLTQDEAA